MCFSLVSLFPCDLQVILKEREERKQRRLLEERGLLPENEIKPVNDAVGEEQCDTNATGQKKLSSCKSSQLKVVKFDVCFCDYATSDEVRYPTEELDQLEFNGTDQMVKEEDEETDKDQETMEQQTTSPVPCPVSQPKIHSRKFRE